MQLHRLAEVCTGTINKNFASVFEGVNLIKTIPSCATLKTYEETPIFVPVDITEEAVESVSQNVLGAPSQ